MYLDIFICEFPTQFKQKLYPKTNKHDLKKKKFDQAKSQHNKVISLMLQLN